MIDLDKLEGRCKKVSRNGDGNHPVIASAESIVELITRLRQAEKDAARYRWLRDGSQVCIDEFANTFRRNRDSFVDEAMQCK